MEGSRIHSKKEGNNGGLEEKLEGGKTTGGLKEMLSDWRKERRNEKTGLMEEKTVLGE